jgi:hypothetical protein
MQRLRPKAGSGEGVMTEPSSGATGQRYLSHGPHIYLVVDDYGEQFYYVAKSRRAAIRVRQEMEYEWEAAAMTCERVEASEPVSVYFVDGWDNPEDRAHFPIPPFSIAESADSGPTVTGPAAAWARLARKDATPYELCSTANC